LDQLGLIPAIEWLGEEMRRTYQLKVLLDDDSTPKPLDSITASILFRAVRELLINVARHSKVKVANIATRCADDQLTVKVMDEGSGFAVGGPSARSTAGLGLAAMRERIAHIGGAFQIKSAPNRGTIATIQVPMKPA
jgi:signal transduction histidine kinase